MGAEFLFMDDNARPHRANIVDECLQSEDIPHSFKMRDNNQNEKNKENASKYEKPAYGTILEKTTAKEEEITKEKKKYTPTQWVTLVTLAFGNFCVGSCVSLQAPFFPAEAERKGATATEYGFIFGIFQLTIFVTAPLMGKIVSKVSPKFLLNSGILSVGVTCILFGTLDLTVSTTAFVALAFVVRTVEGVGAAALRTALYTIIASQFPDGIGTTFAVLETFIGVGMIVGPTVGGALYDLGGYGLPFYVVGSVVILDAIVIFIVLPDVRWWKQAKLSKLGFIKYPIDLKIKSRPLNIKIGCNVIEVRYILLTSPDLVKNRILYVFWYGGKRALEITPRLIVTNYDPDEIGLRYGLESV
ncbi:MFS-type transporter SLC18B1 [Trichonephila clavipes]|nr:MFS-type transporter SLC18B1 [Trichonephila clavipes]